MEINSRNYFHSDHHCHLHRLFISGTRWML